MLSKNKLDMNQKKIRVYGLRSEVVESNMKEGVPCTKKNFL